MYESRDDHAAQKCGYLFMLTVLLEYLSIKILNKYIGGYNFPAAFIWLLLGTKEVGAVKLFCIVISIASYLGSYLANM